ncbi:DUF803-domain-containing protein [Hypoxylon sp. FL1284]|nr:DUF803-domain-containing protein [Hypoxylon sp. FL1284]
MSWTLEDDTSDHKGGSNLGNWSSLIGIVTAISGNILIALALNVQRYAHTQLHRRRAEVRYRAREALKRAQSGHRDGYGAMDAPAQSNDEEPDDPPSAHPLSHSVQSVDSNLTGNTYDESKVASTYLKSPSWWLGQVLMTVGEMGNFLAYGFAPASIVSPLGVVALISNCVIAPIFFGEVFRKRDFWGVVIAVAGAVTVVLSAKQEETKLDPHDVWDAITTMAFEIYMGISVFLIIVLMWASPRYGNRTILIDLGLVGLFGGYTALTTKGVSSMLSSTLFRAFTTPVTYGLIIVLLVTAVMQVRYVNKALQRFDSTQVIPIQFVLFTLSVIIGSAVLYRDFERTTAQQAAKFVGGCLLTFFGVFLITSGRPRHDGEDELSDDENIEETIGLRDQEAGGPYAGRAEQARPDRQQPSASARSSRRSSTSRVSFANGSVKPLSHGTTSRTSAAQTPSEASPLLSNPWENSLDGEFSHPGLPPRPSADSVPTIFSVASAAVTEPLQSNASLPPASAGATRPSSPPSRPSTPRASQSSRPHSHHFSSNAFISPSPLSGTVSAVVADALLRGDGDENSSGAGAAARRRSIRRSRHSLRSSLFVPQEDNGHVPALASDPLLPRAADDAAAAAPYRDDPTSPDGAGQKSARARARSLSGTLGEFFSRKKRRRTSDPEAGADQEGQGGDATPLDPPGNS